MIVFFDGVCRFCNGWVKFIAARDKKKIFQFAPIQGQSALRILNVTDIGPNPLSIILYERSRQKTWRRSDAAILILAKLGIPWSLVAIFWIIPQPIRDWIYDLVAKNRYRWFGKLENCPLPDEALRKRFLD